jgi:hypothetical protein
MKPEGTLYVGYLNTSIGELIGRDAIILSQFRFVVVASVDSAADMTETTVATRIVEDHPGCWFLGQGLVIPGVDIADVSERFNLFNGFDEVWCFDDRPAVEKPVDLWIVSPVNIVQEGVPPLLVPWITESGCRLGLGDGVGLNYVARDKGTAILLEKIAGCA